MPSRKSGSSEVTFSSDSHRTSLKRLSSIASFQNLFTRRRSNNVTDTNNTAQSSSSNLSLSSGTLVNATQSTSKNELTTSTSKLLQREDSLSELPPQHPPATHASSRRSSYICLPDDPIGGMPRSRTFSNLPLPIRAKKTATMAASKSHSRLPSALLPSTRLPSPPTTTRKHSHLRLISAETRHAPVRGNRVKRSDTEPLLGISAQQQTSHLPRSTAFKENISLSPIKRLPALDMPHYQRTDAYASSSSYHSSGQGKESTSSEANEPRQLDSRSSSPLTAYAQHPAIQIARAREYKSSPAYRSSRDRPQTPGTSSLEPAGMQRWNSQPVLTNIANNRPRGDSHHNGNIKQARLLSARPAPTPPPPTKTPLATSRTPFGVEKKAKAANTPSSMSRYRPRPSKNHSPSNKTSSPSQATPSPTPILNTLNRITHPPTHPSYWAGRLSALADRYRNQELSSLLLTNYPTTNPSPKTTTDKLHTSEASLARTKRALEFLHQCCGSVEAERSLMVFQGRFAEVMRMPEVRPRCLQISLQRDGDGSGGEVEGGLVGRARNGGGKEEGGVVVVETGMSERRKGSFMERLLGRSQRGSKRRSLVLV